MTCVAQADIEEADAACAHRETDSPQTPPADHPPAPPAGPGPFQRLGVSPIVTQGAESRCTAICPGRRSSMSARVRRPQLRAAT